MRYGMEISADAAFAIVPDGTAAAALPRVKARPGLRQRLAALLRLWWQRYRSRSELAGLDEPMLRDIGVDRSRAEHESAKPFWRG